MVPARHDDRRTESFGDRLDDLAEERVCLRLPLVGEITGQDECVEVLGRLFNTDQRLAQLSHRVDVSVQEASSAMRCMSLRCAMTWVGAGWLPAGTMRRAYAARRRPGIDDIAGRDGGVPGSAFAAPLAGRTPIERPAAQDLLSDPAATPIAPLTGPLVRVKAPLEVVTEPLR